MFMVHNQQETQQTFPMHVQDIWAKQSLKSWPINNFLRHAAQVLLSLMVLKVYVVTLKTTLVLTIKILAVFHFPFPYGGCKTLGLSAIASADTSEP